MLKRNALCSLLAPVLAILALGTPLTAAAGAQQEEQLASSVVAGLAKAIADAPIPTDYANRTDLQPWLAEMSRRIAHRMTDERERRELLATVHYEAIRAGLDPQIMLGVIYHESGFKKYAISTAGARGYMQVMPFWVKQIGASDQNLFNLRTNLRYGAVILRYYLVDIEKGDYYRALGRYNGSLGRAEYPQAVMAAANRYFAYSPVATASRGRRHDAAVKEPVGLAFTYALHGQKAMDARREVQRISGICASRATTQTRAFWQQPEGTGRFGRISSLLALAVHLVRLRTRALNCAQTATVACAKASPTGS